MSEIKLIGTPRTEFGKGASRRARRDGMVPAVMYGHGTDPVHILVPHHELFMAVRNSANALFEVVTEGGSALALAWQIQRDAVRGSIKHVDLMIVRRGEKVQVEVPVSVEGEAAPSTLVTVELQTIRLEAEATKVPEHVVVNVDGLEAGTIIHTGELELPEGTTLAEEADLQVINVSLPRSAVESTDENEAEAEEEA